jgi:hypothetical protein
MAQNWRDFIDPTLRDHLEVQIKESLRQKNAYIKAEHPGQAQLWCAIANLSRQVFNLTLKINYLERTLKDIIEREEKKRRKVKKKK